MGHDLSQNIVFQALVNHYKDVYHLASCNNWTVCIPVTGFPLKIKRKFILFHILKPSPLLVQHYLTVQKCDLDVEINQDKLIVTRPKDANREEIAIIRQEFAYTKDNKRVNILIIEQSLIKIKPYNGKNYFADKYSLQTSTINTFEDSIVFLRKKSSKALQELYSKCLRISTSSIETEADLEEVKNQLETIIDDGIKKFSHTVSISQVQCLDSLIAIETFVVAVNYDPIFKKMLNIFAKEDEILSKNINIAKNISIIELGAQKYFSTFKIPNTLNSLFNELNDKTSPLEKLHCFKAIFDLLNNSLMSIPGPPINPLEKIHPEKITITSDDILAVTIFSIIQLNPQHINTHVKFVSCFNWRLPSKDEYGYSLTTLEAALMFILNSFVDDQVSSNVCKTSQEEEEEKEKNFQHESGKTTPAFDEPDVISEILRELTLNNVSYDSYVSSANSTISTACKKPFKSPTEENLGSFLSSLRKSQFIVCSGRQT